MIQKSDGERESLLESRDGGNDNEWRTRGAPVKFYWFMPLEVIMVLHIIGLVFQIPITQFYIYDFVAKENGITDIVRGNGQQQCSNNNDSSSATIEKIQKEAARQFMYLSFCSSFPAVIPTLFLGSICDRIGRKAALTVTLIGVFCREVVYVLVFQLKASIYYLYIGNFLEGVTGSYGAALMVYFAMIADITNPGKERAFRITLVEGLLSVFASVATLSCGYWIKYSGFIIPMIFSADLTILNLALLVIFIPETLRIQRTEGNKFSFYYILNCFKFYYKDNEKNRRKKMIISLVVFTLSAAVYLGKSNVQTLFLLNKPLCWTEVQTTIFGSVQTIGNWATVVFLTFLFQKLLKIEDYSFVIIGALSGISSNILFAFASTDWMVYLYAFCGAFFVILIPMMRSVMSRLCSPEEQGALFAGIGCLEMLFSTLSGIFYPAVYQMSSFPGLVFLIVGGVMGIVLIVSIPLCKWLRQEKRVMVLEVESPDRADD